MCIFILYEYYNPLFSLYTNIPFIKFLCSTQFFKLRENPARSVLDIVYSCLQL